MAGALFPQTYDHGQATLDTANTDRDFSSGTVVTIFVGGAPGNPVAGVLLAIPDAVTVATEAGFAVDDGTTFVPLGVVPIPIYTPTVGQPMLVIWFPFPGGPVYLPANTDEIVGRVHTNQVVKVRVQTINF